jgi:Lysine methyltransferase
MRMVQLNLMARYAILSTATVYFARPPIPCTPLYCSIINQYNSMQTQSSLRLRFSCAGQDDCPSSSVAVLRFSLNDVLPSGAAVVPLLTKPIRISSKNFMTNIPNTIGVQECGSDVWNIGKSVCASCIRESMVRDMTIYALESPGYLGIGGKVWDSTFVLVEYLRNNRHSIVEGKRIVELGSGTGILGIGLCSLRPESVVITDLAEVVPLMQSNIELNSLLVCDPILKDAITNSRVTACECTWGKDIPQELLSCDVIVASDVVYDPAGYEPLVKTLSALLNRSNSNAVSSTSSEDCAGACECSISVDDDDQSTRTYPVCILAHRHRHPENHRFFELLRAQEGIVVELIDRNTGTDAHGQSASKPEGVLSDVEIYRIFFPSK